MSFLKPRKIVCLLLCLCMASALFLALARSTPAEEVYAERTIASIDKDIKDCEALLSRLQSEQKDLLADLEAMKGQSTSNAEQAELIAGQIVLLGSQIQLNESLLQSCDMKRSTAQAELILVQNEYEYYSDLFSELMRFIYENGTVNDFELLFSSDSLSDYLSRRDNFNSIMECVSDLRTSAEQSLLKLEDLNREYDVACEKYELYLASLEKDQAELEIAMAEFDILAEGILFLVIDQFHYFPFHVFRIVPVLLIDHRIGAKVCKIDCPNRTCRPPALLRPEAEIISDR